VIQHFEKETFMQRTLRNLAVALVAGTFALAAGAQDKAGKAEKAPAASSKVVVNGVTIPPARFEAMAKELDAQGHPASPERENAIKEELVNRESSRRRRRSAASTRIRWCRPRWPCRARRSSSARCSRTR